MANYVLRTSDGTHVSVKEGASHDIVVNLYDTTGDALEAASMTSIAASLMTEDETVINLRANQSVLNANGGTFATGVLRLKLDPDDSTIVDTTITKGSYETHLLQLTYVYNDNQMVSRTGIETFEFKVEKKLVPSA